jgi:hypothetical protein
MPYYEEETDEHGKKRFVPKPTDAERRLSRYLLIFALVGCLAIVVLILLAAPPQWLRNLKSPFEFGALIYPLLQTIH